MEEPLLHCEEDLAMTPPPTDMAEVAATPLEEEAHAVGLFGADPEQMTAFLDTLIAAEGRRTVRGDYLTTVQSGSMGEADRRAVISWMLKVQEHRGYALQTAACASGYLDRVLSLLPLPPPQLHLAAMACMSVAAKVCETDPLLLSETLAYASMASVPPSHLARMERVVLSHLDWVCAGSSAVHALDGLALAAAAATAMGECMARSVRTAALVLLRTTLPESALLAWRPTHVASAALLAAIRRVMAGEAAVAATVAAAAVALARLTGPLPPACRSWFAAAAGVDDGLDMMPRRESLSPGPGDDCDDLGADDGCVIATGGRAEDVSPSPTSVLGTTVLGGRGGGGGMVRKGNADAPMVMSGLAAHGPHLISPEPKRLCLSLNKAAC